jgi:integrase
MLAGLKAFFAWAKKRHGVDGPKDWPKIGVVEMRFRNTIDLQTQESILEEIKKTEPLRAWLAIKFLSTYISVRPGELVSLTEGQIDRQRGLLIIPHPKEKRPKIVPLTHEDINLIQTIPRSFANIPFFRHMEDSPRFADRGNAFTNHYLLRVWKRACRTLGIEGVDLYGGTKHSTAMGLREVATFEEVRTMTGHSTNRAFERYFRSEGKDLQSLYERRKSIVNPDNQLTTKKNPSKTSN